MAPATTRRPTETLLQSLQQATGEISKRVVASPHHRDPVSGASYGHYAIGDFLAGLEMLGLASRLLDGLNNAQGSIVTLDRAPKKQGIANQGQIVAA
jgi:hypothetical protein